MKGFTRIEVAIILIFTALILFLWYKNYLRSVVTSRDLQRKTDLRFIKDALRVYYDLEGFYPQGKAIGFGKDKDGCSDLIEKAFQCPSSSRPLVKDVPSDPILTTDGYSYYGFDEGRRFFVWGSMENSRDEDSSLVRGWPGDWPFAQKTPYFILTELEESD